MRNNKLKIIPKSKSICVSEKAESKNQKSDDK